MNPAVHPGIDSTSAGYAGREAGRIAQLRSMAAATRLVWRAAPLATLAHAGCALAAAAVPLLVAWLTKLLLDQLSRNATAAAVLSLAMGLAAAGIASSVLPQLEQYLRSEADRAAAVRAEDGLYRAVERFSGLARFEDPRFLDQLRLAQRGASTPGQLIDSVFALAKGTVVGAGFVGSMALISPVMTGILLVTAVPMLLLELQLSRRRAAMLWRIGPTERRQIFYQSLLESPRAAKEIRLYGLGGFLRGRMLDERRTADAEKRRLDRREVATQGGLGLLGAFVAGGGLLWAALSASRGALTIGDVSMFVAAVAGVQIAINTLLQALAQSHQQLLMFAHYLAILRMPPDLAASASPARLPKLRQGIELRDVWFRYSDEHPWALRGLNLSLSSGAATAVVGANGAGKSTLVKLLCRFYDPTYGAIFWDGVNLRDIDVAELRRRIGAVFQDFMEYDLTAAENIAVGDLAARNDRPRLESAARKAGIHTVLAALPRGYDTALTRMFLDKDGEGGTQTGVRLSGGQWQRLALARAFLRDHRELMILDEPSAGLDAEAEYEVHTRLKEHRSGRTSLLISHRLGSIRDADKIVVLGDGVVVEQGTHSGLLAASGEYARLFSLQAAGYRDEDPRSPTDGQEPNSSDGTPENVSAVA